MSFTEQLRMLHWNIHSWRGPDSTSNIDAVTNLIIDLEPHIVSLVEVDEPWGMPDSLRELAGHLGYSWIFVPSFEFGDDTPAGGFGNALLAKLPLVAVQQWQLVWPPRLYDGTEPSEPRSIVFAKLGSFPVPLWVGSTHLPRCDAEARTNALRRLTTLAQKLEGQWLVCGDFNTPALSWLDENRSVTVCPEPAQPTYPITEPVDAIDYCIASTGLTVEARVLQVAGSDHLPLLVMARICG